MASILLTPEQAAAELNIARTRIFDLVARGELRSLKLGKSRRIPRSELEAYIEKKLNEQSDGHD